MIRAAVLASLLALAACNPPPRSYSGGDDGLGLFMLGAGLGMMTGSGYQQPRPTYTNCSSFGMRGQGFNCTSY